MADALFLPPSPWQNDLLLPLRDGTRCMDPDVARIDHDSFFLDPDLYSLKTLPWKDWEDSPLPSTNTSIANSECSEDLSLGLEDELDTVDLLLDGALSVDDSTHVTVFGEKVLSNPVSVDVRDDPVFDWTSLLNSPDDGLDFDDGSQSDAAVSRMQFSRTESRTNTGVSAYSRKKPWSRLDSREQLAIVEELTEVVSQQLGLREQLEVIRIINPRATLSPTDTEFVIDLNCLNDDKLVQVRDYIRQHSPHSHSSAGGDKRTPKKRCSHSLSQASDDSSECSNTSSQKRCSAKQSHRQVSSLKNQRQRKEKRQVLKESRSGLFKKEEVMALSTCSPEEDDNIDVLT